MNFSSHYRAYVKSYLSTPFDELHADDRGDFLSIKSAQYDDAQKIIAEDVQREAAALFLQSHDVGELMKGINAFDVACQGLSNAAKGHPLIHIGSEVLAADLVNSSNAIEQSEEYTKGSPMFVSTVDTYTAGVKTVISHRCLDLVKSAESLLGGAPLLPTKDENTATAKIQHDALFADGEYKIEAKGLTIGYLNVVDGELITKFHSSCVDALRVANEFAAPLALSIRCKKASSEEGMLQEIPELMIESAFIHVKPTQYEANCNGSDCLAEVKINVSV